jgi:hypothetical protein
LAYIGSDGNVAILENGSVAEITNDAEIGAIYSQLTWSQQGDLAFVRSTVGGGEGISAQGLDASIQILEPSGDLSNHEVAYLPFYMYWSPDGSQLAYLGSAAPRLQLSILTVADQESAPLFNSQPLYFDWSPTGDWIVTHHEGDSMVLLLDGEPSNFESVTGRFQAPVWDDVGIYLVSRTEAGSALERRDVAGAITSSRALDADDVSFSLGEGQQVAILQRFDEITGTLGVFGAEDTQLTENALWYFWDPSRTKVLWMEPEGRGVNVKVWNAETSQTTSIATGELSTYWIATYLQFFDQYALSHSWWAPDGAGFVFLGTISDGTGNDRSGIWRLDVSGSSEPEFLAKGLEAVYSP